MKNLFRALENLKSGKLCVYLSIFIVICFFVAMPSSPVHAAWSIKEEITSGLIGWIYTAVYEIMKIVLNFASLLVYFAAWLVDVMLNPSLYRAILTDPTTAAGATATKGAVTVGWETIRDFCNMFYVFFLLLIAFGTIVGSGTYNYKSLLPKFVISLFLINFSKIITLIVIDVGQVFLFGMAAWLGTFSGSEGSGAALTGIVNAFKMTFANIENPTFSDIMTIIFAVVYTFVLAIIYLILAAFLLFRLVMFVVLVIVSPFAFFSMVLPSMRPYTSKWKGMLFSNSISGAVFVFFVYISAMMAKTLTENPITNSSTTTAATSTDVSTLGDISKMQYMEPFLAMIIPHVVAMGLLLFSVSAATMVGAYGSKYIVGGRFGIGKMAGMAYSVPKLGERAARRAGGRAMGGFRWAKEASVRNFKGAAQLQDKLHTAGQNVVMGIGDKSRFTRSIATGIVAKDMAAQEEYKQRIVSDRLKKYGSNLKALDVDLLLKGDNVDKALALKAAAEQGKLGTMKTETFRDASTVMSKGDVKDLTGKNLMFNTVTEENRNKTVDSFAEGSEERKRIDANIKLGMSKDDAVKREIMLQAAKKSIEKGSEGDLQGLDDVAVAGALLEAQTLTGTTDRIGSKLSMKQKQEYRKGLVGVNKNIETDRQKAAAAYKKDASAENKERLATLEDSKVNTAVYAMAAGAKIKDAVAYDSTPEKSRTEHIEKAFEHRQLSPATVAYMDKEDKKEFGHLVKAEKLKALRKRKDYDALDTLKEAHEEHYKGRDESSLSAAELKEKQAKDKFFRASET